MSAAITALAIGMAGMAGTVAYVFTGDATIAGSMAFGGANLAIGAYIAVAYITRQ